MMKRMAPVVLTGLTLVLAATMAETCAEAAAEGLRLCLQTVIPSLFPFLVLTGAFLRAGGAGQMGRLLEPLMRPVFHLPGQAGTALALGLLGGYPVGAQTAGELHRAGVISKADGEALLRFCSNAGPAMFLGMLGGLLHSTRTALVLWGIHIAAALMTGVLFRPGKDQSQGIVKVPTPLPAPDPLFGAVRAMALICGNIVFFRVLAKLLCTLPILSQGLFSVILAGLLEVTGGCAGAAQIPSYALRYPLLSFFLGFGGLCVWMQTRAVLRSSGLSGKGYLAGKLVQGTLAAGFTVLTLLVFPGLLPQAVPVAALPNHAGLGASTAASAGVVLTGFGIWCISLRKRAGKEANNAV